MTKAKFSISLLLVTLLLLVQIMTVEAAKDSGPKVAPVNSANYQKAAADWWTWDLTLPAGVDPFSSIECVKTNLPQNGNMFFLVGVGPEDLTTRTCTVPTGTRLFFPIINNVVVDLPENISGRNTPQVWVEDLLKIYPSALVSATINGVPVNNVKDYLIVSKVFNITLGPSNPFGLPAGTKLVAVTVGYYLLLNPLSPGNYTISFRGELIEGIDDPGVVVQGPFIAHNTYQITVVPGHK